MPDILIASPNNTGRARWADESNATGTPSSFIFQPGGVEEANVYTTWNDLVTAYRAWGAKIDLPDFSGLKEAIIYFDDTYSAISIPTPTVGSPILVLRPGTSFQNARVSSFTTPISDDDRILVTIGGTVVWHLLANAAGEASMRSVGVRWSRAAGSLDPWLDISADEPCTSVILRLTGTTMESASAGLLYSSAAGRAFSLFGSDVTMERASRALFAVAGGEPLRVELSGLSRVQDVFENSVAGPASSLQTRIQAAVQIAQQSGLTLPDNEELIGPSASDNVRPGPGLTVICQDQLTLYGATDIPQILQAFLFGLASGNPTANDTLSITDGTTTETFTFVVAAGVPFEVTIGLTADLTLINLADAITADSTLWKGAFVANPQTGSQAVAIIRQAQVKESYPDRAYGTFASGDPFVGTFMDVDGSGTTRLSYSQADFINLPAADGLVNMAGFATVAPVLDGALVQVLDARSDGVYQALNPLGVASSGSWRYIASPSVAPILINGAGTTVGKRQDRFVVASLAGGVAAVYTLPNTFPPGLPLSVRRTDADGASTFTLTPVPPATIDTLASDTQAVTSGRIIVFDGVDWHTVAAT